MLSSLRISCGLRRAFLLLLLAVSPMANAVYNANVSGRVVWIGLYAEGDYIYVQLDSQPSTHPVCNPAYFVIPQDLPVNRRNQMLAMLMAAKYAGESITIGFDNSTECSSGYLRVHRVG